MMFTSCSTFSYQAPLKHAKNPFLQRRVTTRHYVNVTESGLSGDRGEFHRLLLDMCIYFHDQRSMSGAAQPVSLLNSHTKYTYEGWNFNSGNYLFTTDTK